MDEAASPLIPSFALDLSDVPLAERDGRWRDMFVRNHDILDRPQVLEAQGRVFRLGQAVVTDTVQHRSFVRDRSRTRRDGVDNVLISVELTGPMQVETERGRQSVEAGRVTLFDNARPTIKRGDFGRTLVMGVPRQLVDAALPGVDLHATTLGAGGGLLAEHLRNLRQGLPTTSMAAGPALVSATVAMLAACLSPTGERLEEAQPTLAGALLTRAKRYIRANCVEPDLTPERVATAVGASRTSLYRAFEPEGGVAEAIRRARLEAARAALRDVHDPRRIGEIAFAYGFNSEAQFSRSVRAAFGATPTELRRGHGGDGLYVPAAENRWVKKPLGKPTPQSAEVIALRPRSRAAGAG